MTDIKLFQIVNKQVVELEAKSAAIEKSLQTLIENHLDCFLGVKFLATEYNTGEKHAGRIDTLGIDENNCPVIIEYKRTTSENVINQGLYYLDWLLDHKAEFQILVIKKLGQQIADMIEWENARMICIAEDFTKYDTYAVMQINRNVELIRYKQFGNLLLFELVNAITKQRTSKKEKQSRNISRKSVGELLDKSGTELRERFENLKSYVLGLGDEITMKELLHYYSFTKIKSFICVEIHPQNNTIVAFLKLNPKKIKHEDGFLRDVTNIGHLGTGDVEITITCDKDLEKAKPYIQKSYEVN